jgi:hypothetical protein
LIMQLMMPTPMKALRQARSASPSSERRALETAAIYPDLFASGGTASLTDLSSYRPFKSH